MTWRVNLEEIARDRDDVARRVRSRPWSHPLEQLARAHRWLEEEQEARRFFGEASRAAEAEWRIYHREDAGVIARIGSLALLAFDPGRGRSWLEQALPFESRPDRRAALLYLLGDLAGSLASAAEESERPYPWLEATMALAEARRTSDPERASAAAEGFAACIRAERMPPDQESGSVYSLFDWLEEAYRVQAEAQGSPPPDHATILERAGLLRKGPARPPKPPPDLSPSQTGSYTLERPGPDDTAVNATVVVDDGHVTFQPLPGRDDLRVKLDKLGGQWRVNVGGSDLLGEFWGYREALGVAATRLREAPDGDWAIATVDALATASFGGQIGGGTHDHGTTLT